MASGFDELLKNPPMPPDGEAIKNDRIREVLTVRYSMLDGSELTPTIGEDGHFRRLAERVMNALTELQTGLGVKVEVKYP